MLQKLFIFSIVLLAFISCSHTISREQKEVDKPKELNIKDSAYRIEGKFFLVEGKSVYDSFDFKGKSTVVINSFGLDFVTTYTKDEEYLRIDANPTDILLKIHSKEMIEGEGFASGIFVKDSLLKTKQRQHEEEPIKKSVPSNNIQENPVKKKPNVRKDDVIERTKEKTDGVNKVAGAFGIGSAEGNNQGDAETGIGNQGSPFGNSDHGENDGIGGYGSFNLNGRSIGAGGLPRPAYTIQEEGKIVINITVNPKGKVIFAEIGRGTNIDNASMRKSALEAAKRATFNSISGANNQSGTITYVYKLK